MTQTIVATGYDQSDTVFRMSFNFRATLTYNGVTLRSHAGGHVKAVATDGVFSGAHTELVAESGVRSKLSSQARLSSPPTTGCCATS